jgi:phage gp36-like protein
MSEYCLFGAVNAPGVSDPDKHRFVIEASGEADSYIGKRYRLPLVVWGGDLGGHVRRMTRYHAFADRGFDPANPADQAIVRGYDSAIAWLKMVASGDVELVGAVDSTPSLEEAGPVHSGEDPRHWLWGSNARDNE